MSSCWKCGQKTPEGIVECDDGCRPQALRELMALADEAKPPQLCLTIQLFLDHVKVAGNPAGHHAATLRFSELLGAAIVESGLSEYIKAK